jgi:hypothetical protein
MVPLRRIVAISGLGLLLAACADESAGNAETDRQSETLAVAISYPRQEDAAGFARAALATTLGKSSDFSILEATDLPHETNDEPKARLVWRIHADAYDSGWKQSPEMNACYTVEFNYYGATTGPDRTPCPENATPITPPPLPYKGIPPTYGPALEATLGALPPAPSEADVRAALATGLPAPAVDPETGLTAIPPDVLVKVEGADVGVALFARTGVESKECVMGHRVAGVVRVWGLNWRDLGPHEASCDAEAALTTP